MKKILILLLILPNLLLAQAKFTEAMLNNFNQKLKESPEATIKANTHPNFTFITGKGQRVGYKELLANYTYNVETVREMTDLKVSQAGSTATATGKIHHAWHPKGKPEELSHYTGMFTYVYAYQAGKWKIISAQHSDISNTERNKALYKAINKAANEGKLEEASQYYAEEHESKGIGKGPKAELIYAQAVMKSFPDLQIKILNLIAEGDLVMARCEAAGTQLGEMNGIPATGKKGTIAHWTINRFNAEGKITESYNLNDNLGMMQQLGILK